MKFAEGPHENLTFWWFLYAFSFKIFYLVWSKKCYFLKIVKTHYKMLKISPLYGLKKKFEFSTLRKYCVFPIRMRLGKCSSCSTFFVLNRFFSADLGKFLPMLLKLWFFPYKVAATYPKPTRNAHFWIFHACAVCRGYDFLKIL